MCDLSTVISGVSLGSTILSTGASLLGEKKKADSNLLYKEQTQQSALNNFIQQSKALNNRMAEEQEATGQQKEQIRIENMKAKAEAQASSASAGLTGTSIINLYKGYARATAQSNYTLSRNLYLKGLQTEQEKIGYRNQYLSTINIMPTYEPNYLGIVLNGLGKIGYMGSNILLKGD